MDEFPYTIEIVSLQIDNGPFWREMPKEKKLKHFVEKILPKYRSQWLLSESEYKTMTKTINFKYDIIEHRGTNLFNAINVTLLVRFKTKQDIMLWKLQLNEAKKRGIVLNV